MSGEIERSSCRGAPAEYTEKWAFPRTTVPKRAAQPRVGTEAGKVLRLQKRKRFAQSVATLRLDIIAVAHDDAVKIPTENAIDGRAHRGCVLDHTFLETRRTETPECSVESHDQRQEPVAISTEVEREVGDDEAAARTMQEHDFVQERHAPDEMLINDVCPLGGRRVGQRLSDEKNVAPEVGQTGSCVKLCSGIFSLELTQAFVVISIRTDDVANFTQCCDLRAECG